MAIIENLTNDMKDALKKGETLRLSVIRGLINEIKNKKIEKRAEVTDQEALELFSSALKRRNESIEEFAKGGRQDLVDKEKSEADIIRTYLPQPLTDDEIKQIIIESIRECGATSKKELGKVMKTVMPKFVGRADGKIVNRIVLECLGN